MALVQPFLILAENEHFMLLSADLNLSVRNLIHTNIFSSIDATSTTFSVSTVSYPASTTSQSKDQPVWDVVILFGSIAFILFAGFLIWLGGKVYVALFGMPELIIEHAESNVSSHGRLGQICGEITSRDSTESEETTLDNDQPSSSLIYNGNELQRQVIENIRTQGEAMLQSSLIPPVVTNLYNLEQLPFHGVDDLAEALGHKSRAKELPRRQEARNLFPPQTKADVIARHNERMRSRNFIHKVLYSASSCRLNPQGMMDFHSLGQMPFYWVVDLTRELNSEPDVVRRFFNSLLPFYGEVNWVEVHMASWEFSRLLLLELPFCDVSDEVLRECACSSVSGESRKTRSRRRCVEVFNDVEAAVSSSKEQPRSPRKAVDFVHYENEILKKATKSIEINC